MEPTEFEKWCAGDMGCSVEFITQWRHPYRGYSSAVIDGRYRAWVAGVTSMLPYQAPAKGATNELD